MIVKQTDTNGCSAITNMTNILFDNDEYQQTHSWTDKSEFAAVYAAGQDVKTLIRAWKQEGRCMLLDKTPRGERYLIGDDAGYFNLLILGPTGAGWWCSNGVKPTRLGYAISGVIPPKNKS